MISQIRTGKDWRNYLDEIRFVLSWIMSASQWSKGQASVVASEEGIESSKLSQVSSRTFDLIFEVLKSDLERIVGLSTARFAKITNLLPQEASDEPHDEADLVAVQSRYLEFVLSHLGVEICLRAEKLKSAKIDDRSREILKANLKTLWGKRQVLLGLETALQSTSKPLTDAELEGISAICRECFSEDLHDIFSLEI